MAYGSDEDKLYDSGDRPDPEKMMPDPPMMEMRRRMNRGHMPVPPQQVQEAMETIAEMERQLEEMRRDLMGMGDE